MAEARGPKNASYVELVDDRDKAIADMLQLKQSDLHNLTARAARKICDRINQLRHK